MSEDSVEGCHILQYQVTSIKIFHYTIIAHFVLIFPPNTQPYHQYHQTIWMLYGEMWK